MKFLTYIIFRLFTGLFRFIPFLVLYRISDTFSFLLHKIFKYRLHVIQKNIKHCLPELSEKQQKEIVKNFYTNFVDISLESIKGLSISPESLIPRFKLLNPEILDPHINKNETVICFSQHYNNWEWGSISLGLQMEHHVVGIVKFLSNKYINQYIMAGRTGNNVSVVPTFKTKDYFNDLPQQKQAIVFIADQMPYKNNIRTDVNFFGNPTPFHLGAAHYSIQSGLPVYSIDIRRIKRGYYEVEIFPICVDPSQATPESITHTYVTHLEALILESKHSWLWSHKRFKGIVEYNN